MKRVFFVIFACLTLAQNLIAKDGRLVFENGATYLIPYETGYGFLNKDDEMALQIPQCKNGDIAWFSFNTFAKIKAGQRSEMLETMRNAIKYGNAGCEKKLSDQEVSYYQNSRATPNINVYQNQEPDIRLPKSTNCVTIGGITNCITY